MVVVYYESILLYFLHVADSSQQNWVNRLVGWHSTDDRTRQASKMLETVVAVNQLNSMTIGQIGIMPILEDWLMVSLVSIRDPSATLAN